MLLIDEVVESTRRVSIVEDEKLLGSIFASKGDILFVQNIYEVFKMIQSN